MHPISSNYYPLMFLLAFLLRANRLKPAVVKFFRGLAVDNDQKAPPIENKKLTILREIVQENRTRREILGCLSDGMWHTTSELARYARKTNPVMGLVTVGTILSRMQEQLGEHFLEQMVQKAEEGITSWRIGVDWLDIVNEILKEDETPSNSSIFNA